MIWLLAGIAAAQPACDVVLTAPTAELSVAWVSPLRRKVGRRGWLEVVRTAELRKELAERPRSVGRMLQLLGLRKRGNEPGRRWKVTIFDARSADLCRPLSGYEEAATVQGVATCPERLGKPGRAHDGCGWTVDRADGTPGLETFRIRWEDAARNGFCVLPAERFVSVPAP